jgi:hypothetical protein
MTYKETREFLRNQINSFFPAEVWQKIIDALDIMASEGQEDDYTYSELKAMHKAQQETIAKLQDEIEKLSAVLTRH